MFFGLANVADHNPAPFLGEALQNALSKTLVAAGARANGDFPIQTRHRFIPSIQRFCEQEQRTVRKPLEL